MPYRYNCFLSIKAINVPLPKKVENYCNKQCCVESKVHKIKREIWKWRYSFL